MTGDIAWTGLVFLLAVLGRLAWHGVGPRAETLSSRVTPARWAARAEESWLALVSGFGLLSVGFFVLAHLGHFTTPAVAAFVAIFVAGCAVACHRRRLLGEAVAALPLDLALGVALAVSSLWFGMLLPPLDTTIAASDSSVYLATAHQLARQGTIKHRDPLVAEMTPEERELLFRNRFEDDHTGPYARFPGGVSLAAPTGDTVSFYFYHLFPIWLAVGLKTVGSELYLRLMGLFACIGLGSLFFVGRRLGGTALGLALCVVHPSFYPQVFFSRFPTSELLAQALFLSGLGALLRGLDPGEGSRRPYTHLAGLLWGVLCLCRVDALPFLWLGLTVMSALPARTGIRATDWAIPMLMTALFGSMAVYHQISNGVSYVGAFPPGRLADMASAAVAGRQWPSLVVLAVLAGAGALVLRCDAAGPRGVRLHALTRAFGLVASAATLGVFLVRLDWALVVRHVRWIAMYATSALLLLLCAGVLVALTGCLLGRAAPGVSVALAFFVGPALCYLIDPLVIAQQPWAMRRFVPLIFPLLFLLALHGWQAGLRHSCGRRAGLAEAVFAGLAIVTAGTFLRSSAGLARHRAGADASAQVRALAKAIPSDALIVIPDSNASLHTQIALEYMGGREVLLLPLADGPGGRLEEAMIRFLARQIERRRVCLLLARPTDLAGPLVRPFQLRFLFEKAVSFESVEFVAHDAFPEPPATARLQNRVWEVRPPENGQVPRSIRVGDARDDVGILMKGFHGPEIEVRPGQPPTPFRWTGPVATMAFPPVAAVALTMDTSRPATAKAATIEVDVDGVPVDAGPTDRAGWHRLHVPMPGPEGAAAKRMITLRVNAFNMKALGLSDDARELGVRIVSAEIEP